ncbi:hypothetical protein DFH09DRAFT_1340301 [Mycena vulgaris]|nr:hypothetical protein DFH09DRAFT_1340301 [Mycena vulgaris]
MLDADEEDSDDGQPWDDEEDENEVKGGERFSDAESLFNALRVEFLGGKAVEFSGSYTLRADPLVSPKKRVKMVAAEIWKVGGYRFTVKDHRALKSGHRTRYWCSQDEVHKKKSKASQDPDVRNRDTLGMKSQLTVSVQLRHGVKHTPYVDVTMPEAALDIIRDNAEWSTPVELVGKVQAAFPAVSAQQIHRAWMEFSELYWRFDDAQLPSAEKLLQEHGDDKISGPLRGKIVEIGVDATYNTNSKHLELYSIMGEYEGAGFPLSYLLLSTASSIDQGKRRKALTAWAKCVRNTYGIEARFSHVNKDMAEIGMLLDVWKTKISLCWWHLRRAVRTRLANGKLSTTPYDPAARMRSSPSSIQPSLLKQPHTFVTAKGLRITLPGCRPLGAASMNQAAIAESTNPLRRSVPSGEDVASAAHAIAAMTGDAAAAALAREPEAMAQDVAETAAVAQDVGEGECMDVDAADPAILARAMKAHMTGAAAPVPKATAPKKARVVEPESVGDSERQEEEEEMMMRRTFCPPSYREPIVSMMEKHFCAHPLLPGYAEPSPEGIKRWAVQQMYKFCVEHGLPEVWAYLWENWYCESRWALWARSMYPEIPVLKTTMILESHWRRIKHDFLHHFHMPRCDLLVWILVTKLAPCYYRKLDTLLTDTGRFRELPAWRKDFKREWKKLERTPITLPLNPAYKTDTKRMLCTCSSLAKSCFLLCKHVVQSMCPVPPVFFLEVKRQRSAPFWVHASLRPASEPDGTDTPTDCTDNWDTEMPTSSTAPAGAVSDLTSQKKAALRS